MTTKPFSPLHPAYWLSTCFYIGKIPFAPGTWGSLAALPLAYPLHVAFGGESLILASLAIFSVGWWSSCVYLRRTGKGGDPKEIVIDEVAGQLLLLSIATPQWESYAICFFLFRFFDILKPAPILWADRLIKGGFGVMFDDMLAGLFPLLLIDWLVNR